MKTDPATSIADRYAQWADKGQPRNGQRITLLSEQPHCQVGDPVVIWHVFEAIDAGSQLCIMGPKTVPGEYVDGILRTHLPPEGLPYPWQALYDGAVLPGPGIDMHWEASRYTFDQPGLHTVQWKVGGLESNVLVVAVVGK